MSPSPRLPLGSNGVVTRAQLVAAGLGRRGIEWRVKTRRLHSLYRGVYLVGHAVLPPLAREMGAVLACGDGAVLSHRSAAAIWRLPVTPSIAAVDVTVVAKMRAKRAGINLHRT